MLPGDVVDLAVSLGLGFLAVTDHDSMSGVKPAQLSAERHGLKIIPGMEVSAYDYGEDRKVHLLAYCPQNPKLLLDFCRPTLQSRQETALKIIETVSRRYPVTRRIVEQYAAESDVIYKQHVVAALMDRGYDTTLFGPLFHELFSAKGGWARFDTTFPDALDALRAVKESGAVAVLAHPGLYGNFDLLPRLCALGLDGVEARHPRHSPEDTRIALEAAGRHGLFVTGGSDFHGMYTGKPNPLDACATQEGDIPLILERI